MKALITGITGQDGSYLAEHLLEKGYEVTGLYRRTSNPNFSRIRHILDDITLVEGDVTDQGCIYALISRLKPNLIFNLAAQSHVATSFSQPSYTTNATYLGVLNILEAIKDIDRNIKFYQASSSEMFGKSVSVTEIDVIFDEFSKYRKYNPQCFQDEKTPFIPQSPYGIAKLAGHHLVRLYRESYGLFACSGILFNHESPRRGEQFVTRKITKWIGEFQNSKNKETFPKLRLGNLEAKRDWGHAKDYTLGMIQMLEHSVADDYVLATGETHTIEEFLEEAFRYAGIVNWKNYVEIDKDLFRPAEVDFLLGNSNKARNTLGWKPVYNFSSLVQEMVDSDSCEKKMI